MKIIALALCGLICYAIALFAPDGPIAVFAPILISYHVFLAYLVLSRRKKGEVAVGSAFVIHFACVVLLCFIALFQEYIPYFAILRFCVPCLALLETPALFCAGSGQTTKRKGVKSTAEIFSMGTSEDYDRFIQYLHRADRRFSMPGRSIPEEYSLWLAANTRRHRAMNPQKRSA